MKQPARGKVAKKHVILFLAANPRDTSQLALDREARAIQLELKRSGYRDRFELVTWWAAEPLDLLRALRERPPTIVHFSGHGARPANVAGSTSGRDIVVDFELGPDASAPSGVMFARADGSGQVVTPAAFGQTLAAAGVQVRLVVLNACFTAPMAQALAAHVDCVVGMTGAIHDDAARIFSIGFYGGLGEQASVAAAFAHGKAAVNLEGLPDVDRPQLVVRDGFDVAKLILAAAEPSVLVDLPCPYPGMRPFSADDTERFHGRDGEIAELIGRLRAGEREIFVIGPSGSGKSSLVTAGVLPRLARGASGLGRYVVRELRPGEQPAIRLAEALAVPAGAALVVPDQVATLLAHHAGDARLLVVVDQLEELFTLAGAAERAAFLAALGALGAERRCAVVFTLRADFFGALMESDLWAERRGKLSRIEVSPLRGEALREAITAPAHAVGVTVDPELTERLLADAAAEPGILPLLQETMVQLWDARTDQTLTLADYQALGDGERSGLSVALARRADATLRRFDEAQTAIARRILLRLISFGEGRSDTRRQQSPTQLRSAGDDAEAFAWVLQAMVEDRLLTVDDDLAGKPQVDLSHEALIAAWPDLRRWIDERRTDEQRRRRLEAQVGEWIERGRGAASLLDAVALAEAEKWRVSDAARELGPPDGLADLVAASQRAIDESERQRRREHGPDRAGVGRADRQAAHRAPRASRPCPGGGVQPRRRARRHREQGQDCAAVGTTSRRRLLG
ncbi:MAG TPA: CHAT domain-containing protein [Kofleriaceae bacterium]|nr:CHAT domain-containing protein [Kofleriaceae bacterium]